MANALQLGDLVRHVHLGGLGIITGERIRHSNITMGDAKWLVVKWINPIGGIIRDCFMPAFLEKVEQTDKK